MKRIAIFSLESDLHAHAILHKLRRRDDVVCHFVATDALVERGGLRWRQRDRRAAQLLSYEGDWFDVAELDVVWWRRVNQPQKQLAWSADEATRDFVNNEWRSALAGLMHDGFHGRWINHPSRDVLAGNKLYQLNVAASVGLRVPRTLVSQDPDVVRDFCAKCDGRVVAKKLLGTASRPLATVAVTLGELSDDESIRVCPAIYQEVIDGTRHIRANCFGDTVHSILIESSVLDWRRDLSVPFSAVDLDEEMNGRLLELLASLGLRMGIMDLMLDSRGEAVWLELNTQGQFLFGEALSGRDLSTAFADFLVSEATAEQHSAPGI
jgi:hypothetical protein